MWIGRSRFVSDGEYLIYCAAMYATFSVPSERLG